jgi:hypothetical protein
MTKISEILIVPHTHHDIGYTHVPDVCLRAHEQAIGHAMALCELDSDDTSASAFRWTVEISRPLVEFLNHASDADIRLFQSLVARERISLTGGYLHMTQLIGTEEYRHFFLPVRDLRKRYSLPVSIVQHGDINGLSWGSVPLMREAGLDTLVMALNPDHGRAPFEQPSAFFWEGPDGSRVLVWLSIHYANAGYFWKLLSGRIDDALAPISALIQQTEQRTDYPFDCLIVHAAFDNMMPDRKIIDAVREWNAHSHLPPMRIVTMDQAIGRIRTQITPGSLPVHRGEWADWWAHGHASSAREVAQSRSTRSRLRTAEFTHALARLVYAAETRNADAMAAPPYINWYGGDNFLPHPGQWESQIRSAYDKLLLFEEHTWGSFESISRPSSTFTQTHWSQKAALIYGAESEAHFLNREAISALAQRLPAADEKHLVIINPLPYRRDELITLVTSTHTKTQERQILVEDLPPLGIKVIPVPQTDARVEIEAVNGDVTILENAFYRLEVDIQSASIVSLYDKEAGREWVDKQALGGIGAVVYEEADVTDSHPSIHTHRRHFHPDTPGPRFIRTGAVGTGEITVLREGSRQMLTVASHAPYLPWIKLTITLCDHQKWIDIGVSFQKNENYRMEGVYVLFPFAMDRPSFRLETANAIFEAGKEQLPDTCNDWYSIQHAAAISDGHNSVLWATREAPLIQIGGFHTGEWNRELKLSRGHIYSWLMNNLYFTNFKAAQGGPFRFDFRFTTRQGEVTNSEITRWGDTFGNPPFTYMAGSAPGTYEWIEVNSEHVIVDYVRCGIDNQNALILRLRETAGKAGAVTVTWKRPGRIRVAHTDFLEQRSRIAAAGDDRSFQINLNAYEQLTIEVLIEEN